MRLTKIKALRIRKLPLTELPPILPKTLQSRTFRTYADATGR
jgi:hypothetical protein